MAKRCNCRDARIYRKLVYTSTHRNSSEESPMLRHSRLVSQGSFRVVWLQEGATMRLKSPLSAGPVLQLMLSAPATPWGPSSLRAFLQFSKFRSPHAQLTRVQGFKIRNPGRHGVPYFSSASFEFNIADCPQLFIVSLSELSSHASRSYEGVPSWVDLTNHQTP